MRQTATAGLYVERRSFVHDLAPHVKVVAAVGLVSAVVCTPRTAFWAFAALAALVVTIAAAARIPATVVARRMVIEVPFLAGALLLPFVASGPHVDVAGVSLSRSGLWDAWNVLAKATIGSAVAVLLCATTRVPDLLAALQRLRVPRVVVAVAGFAVRYGDVLADDLRRARVARLARGHDPRWLWQARAVAAGAGATFVRSFERGERVHLAMLARGYDPSVPIFATRCAARHHTVAALAAVAVAWAIALGAWATS